MLEGGQLGHGGRLYHVFKDLCALVNLLDLEQVRETKRDNEKGSKRSPSAETHSFSHVFPGKGECSWEPCTF